MTKLKLVPKTEPSDKEKALIKMRNRPRPEGMLQCNRCGCRGVLQIKAGVFLKDGKKKGGTVIVKDICAFCWKHGIFSEMIVNIKPAK